MPIGRLLLKFSLPAIAGMIVNSLYNLVDRIFVGRIGGLAMTGIGLSMPFMLLLSAVSSMIRIGASALISIKLGENNKNEAKGLLGNAITLIIGLMLLMMGFAPFVMQLSSVFVSILSNNALKTYGGDIAIGAMTIINAVMVLFLMSAMGVTQGASPIIGFNFGAKRFDRVKQILKLELITVATICTFTFFLVQVFPVALSSIFTNDRDLISMASSGMRLLLLMLPLLNTQMVGASYFQAIGEAKKSAFLGLSRQVLLLIPLLLILPRIFGLNGVWGSSILADLISSLIAIISLKSAFNHLNKLEHNFSSEEYETTSSIAE